MTSEITQQHFLHPGDLVAYPMLGEIRYFLILKWTQNKGSIRKSKVYELYKVWDLKNNVILECFFDFDDIDSDPKISVTRGTMPSL
jgi:hypothetical protein